jgi:transposase
MAGYGQRYTQEFKDSAIQLALNNEKSVLKLSAELGVHEKTLYGWVNKYKKDHNLEVKTLHKKSSNETLEEENRRLRKELANVKKDREILKKAAAYFARETH